MDYVVLNLAVFFVYVDVIYKNAYYLSYLLYYYIYAGILINIDTNSYITNNGYVNYLWIDYMAVFANVLCAELGISGFGLELFVAWFILPLHVLFVLFGEVFLIFGLVIQNVLL